jgi:phosphoribosylformylglycinamidine synthase
MPNPRIAIITFPGTNGDTENLRAFWRNGFDAFVFRWNDSKEKLANVDGYFIGAGFSYEDRGRAGMVAARDPIFQFLHGEAEQGKVILGNCNGAQVLVESGLIPMGNGLRMSLARNAVRVKAPSTKHQAPSKSHISSPKSQVWYAPGFLNEWVWIKRTCARDRCASSNWVDSTGSPYDGVLHIPIAHGEGRFVTKDPDLIAMLEENDQIAFRYCDANGNVSDDPAVTPNGSMGAIAGICNPAGNVVALMPHPERTTNGDPYFLSVKKWIESGQLFIAHSSSAAARPRRDGQLTALPKRRAREIEIFIDTIIVNNEERTVEQAAHRLASALKVKQYRYLAPVQEVEELLTTISLFNSNKEIAYVRRCQEWFRWSGERRTLEPCKVPLGFRASQLQPFVLLRRDEPDIGAAMLGEGSETGICYVLHGVSEQELCSNELLEIFANPHASSLEQVV